MKRLFIVTLVLCFLLAGCSDIDREISNIDLNNDQDNSSNENTVPTLTPKPISKTSPTPTPEPTPTVAAIVYLEEDEIPYMYSSTILYEGKYVKLSGRVFGEPERDGNATYFQMWQDIANNDNNTIIIYYDDIVLKDGDYVTIDGMIYDTLEYQNAFGGTISAPRIIAGNVELSTYQDIVAPAEKTIEINETQEQYGYEVILEKVEFAKNETRLYITVNNNGGSNFSVYSFNMKIIQNKKQYEEQDNWDADYPEIQTDLYPDTITSGIVCFPVISQTDDFVLYIDGGSDDWDEDIKEYKFTVKVK